MNASDLNSMYLKFGITDEIRAGLVALAKLGPAVYAEAPKLVVDTVIIANGKRTVVGTEAPSA